MLGARVIFRCAVILLACAASTAAQQVLLETVSGKQLAGTVIADDGESVDFKTVAGATATFRYAVLTPESQYRLKRLKVDDHDAAAQLALAEWCVDATLYPEARALYRSALEAGPELSEEINKSLTAAHRQAAEEVLQRAKSLQAAGKDGEARELLGRLVQELPLEPAAKQAARMLGNDMVARQVAMAVVPDRDPSDDEDTSRRFSNDAYAMFAKGIDHYKKALDRTHRGLTNKSQSGAIKDFEKALNELARSRSEADKAVKRGGSAPDLDEVLPVIDEKLNEASADVRIHLSNAYLLRSSYNQAAAVINEGLAEQPHNSDLTEALNRVTAAAASNDNGWVIGRRGR